ncbi:hypothetical protein BD413DRAFT_61614 [Trametes elegans]|nr:hypothetical protein BD413DRAFT_61614 [Trametes elegans]
MSTPSSTARTAAEAISSSSPPCLLPPSPLSFPPIVLLTMSIAQTLVQASSATCEAIWLLASTLKSATTPVGHRTTGLRQYLSYQLGGCMSAFVGYGFAALLPPMPMQTSRAFDDSVLQPVASLFGVLLAVPLLSFPISTACPRALSRVLRTEIGRKGCSSCDTVSCLRSQSLEVRPANPHRPIASHRFLW